MSEEMTSLERCLATIRYQPHDRVPVDLHNFMMTVVHSQLLPRELYQNGKMLGEAQIAAWKRFGHDMLLIENGTAALAQACGCDVNYAEEGAPRVEEPFLKDISEISKLRKPDPSKSSLCRAVLDATRFVLDQIGDRVCVMGRADQGPFALACMLAGTVPLLLEMRTGENDDLIFQLLDYTTEAYLLYANMFKEMGCPGTSLGEALCSPDVISPTMYKKYGLPYGKKIVAALQSEDFFVAYHVCGNTTRSIELMVETGAKILEFDYPCSKSVAKSATAGKSTLLGPIDPNGVLHQGSMADVENACREAIEVLAPGGGFILGPGCALPPTVPSAALDKMIECAKTYGRY